MDKMSKVTVLFGVAAAMMLGVNAFAEEAQAGARHKRGSGMNPEKMFQAWDANKDGKVTKEEYIASHEARAKQAGKEIPADRKTRMETRFAAMAGDDGSLTKEEFNASCEKMKKEHSKSGEGKCSAGAPAPAPAP